MDVTDMTHVASVQERSKIASPQPVASLTASVDRRSRPSTSLARRSTLGCRARVARATSGVGPSIGVAQRGPMSDGHALWKSMGWRAWNIGSRLCLAPSRCADPAAQSDRPRSCRHLQVGLDDGAPLGVR